MTASDPRLNNIATTLDRLVSDGALVGWVAGVREGASSEIRTGGSRGVGGEAMTQDTLFAIASCTKPIAGVLALRLADLGVLGLDGAVEEWLPELADPRVLRRPDGPLDETVAADRPITLRHLLTNTAGVGWVDEAGPLQSAMAQQEVAPGPFPPPMDADEFMTRLGGLPLASQPGATWRYHTSSDVLGVLLARATGQPVGELLREHILGPLAMTDTGFVGDPGRMATAYGWTDSGLQPFPVPPGTFVETPRFESLATGLVSSVADQLRFLAALAIGGAPVLGPATMSEMRTDQLADHQRPGSDGFLGAGSGWGHQVEVRADGCFGWAGGLGTIGYADPRSGRAAVLFTQCSVEAPGTQAAFDAFWSLLA